MEYKCFLSPTVFIVASVLHSPVNAASHVSANSMSFSQLKHHFSVNSLGIAQKKMAPVETLNLVQEHVDSNRVHHLRLQQYYAGFPVYGGYVIAHMPDKTISTHRSEQELTGAFYENLAADLGHALPSFTQNSGMALQHFKSKYNINMLVDEQITPIIYVNRRGKACWAYRVSLTLQPKHQIPERPTAIIDANTFEPFLLWNDIKTHRTPVKGQGYGGNERVGLYLFGQDLPFLQLTRDDDTGLCFMENNEVRVVDMKNDDEMKNDDYAPRTPMSFNCQNQSSVHDDPYWTGYKQDGYDLQNGAYSPSNDALYIGQLIKDMYSKWYGVNVLTHQNKPMQLIMRVHYGLGYENAFWDGREMTFGDGDNTLYPLVSLGIGAHEISHGFTEQHSDLLYFDQSGGMNEAFSDMAAQVAEFYFNGKTSWQIGREIVKESSGYEAFRFMDKPSRDGRSIDRASQFRDNMNVHESSGVYNRLFYLLANQPGWNVRQAFQVMLKANMDYWMPMTNFQSGACGVIRASRDLGFSDDAVKLSLDEVDIDYRECS